MIFHFTDRRDWKGHQSTAGFSGCLQFWDLAKKLRIKKRLFEHNVEGSSVIQHCQVGYHMAHGNMKYERGSKGSGRKFRSVLPRVPTSFSSALISPFPFFFKHLQAIACGKLSTWGSREKSLESGRGKVSPLALVFSHGCFARNIKWRACLQGIGIGTRKR